MVFTRLLTVGLIVWVSSGLGIIFLWTSYATGEALSWWAIDLEIQIHTGVNDSWWVDGSGNELFPLWSLNESWLVADQTIEDLREQPDDTVSWVVDEDWDTTPIIQIIEVYSKDSDYWWEYLLLSFSTPYSGSLLIFGLGVWQAEKTINLNVTAWTRVIVTDSPEKIVSSPLYQIISLSSITLTDGGEPLTLQTLSWAVLDSIVYTQANTASALSFSTTNDTGVRVFDTPIPPYPRSVLSIWEDDVNTPPWEDDDGWDPVLSGNSGTPIIDLVWVHYSWGIYSWMLTITNLSSDLCATLIVSSDSLLLSWSSCEYLFEAFPGFHQITILDTTQYILLPDMWTSRPASWSVECVEVKNFGWGWLRLTEIHPRDTEYFPEYIELQANEPFQGTLFIDWLWQWTATKEVSLSLLSWMLVVITDKPWLFVDRPASQIVALSSISLTDAWETITLRSVSWQEIDKAVYLWQNKQFALWVSEEDEEIPGNEAWTGMMLSGDELNVRVFTTPIDPTPWFFPAMVAHLIQSPDTKTPSCGIVRQHDSPLYVTNKINLQAMVDGSFLQNSTTTYVCEWLFSGADISTFTGCNPSFLWFAEPGIFPVTLRVEKSGIPLCETTSFLNLPNNVSTKKSPSWGSSYYEGLYRKRKERFERLSNQAKKQWLQVSASGDILGNPLASLRDILPDELLQTGSPSAPTVAIIAVLPNPEWRDTLWEQIIIENQTDETISTNDLLLDRGKSTKGLPPDIDLLPQTRTTLSGDLGLTNKPTCLGVRFRGESTMLSWFCYPQLAEGERFSGWLIGIGAGSLDDESDILWWLRLSLEDEEVCVLFSGQELLCSSLPYAVSDAKQRKKDAKKKGSLEKKVSTLQEKYDLRRGKYRDQTASYRTKEQWLLAKMCALRADLADEKTTRYQYSSLYFLLKNELLSRWWPVLSIWILDKIERLRHSVLWGKPLLFSWGTIPLLSLPSDTIYDRYYLLYHQQLPLDMIDTTPLLDGFWSKLARYKLLLSDDRDGQTQVVFGNNVQ